jgi:hypothetical protein
MNPNQKLFLIIGSSGMKIDKQRIRQDINGNGKGNPLRGIQYDLRGLVNKYFSKQNKLK